LENSDNEIYYCIVCNDPIKEDKLESSFFVNIQKENCYYQNENDMKPFLMKDDKLTD
jgi:hypothetical protein